MEYYRRIRLEPEKPEGELEEELKESEEQVAD
jgi:hypothetical protein